MLNKHRPHAIRGRSPQKHALKGPLWRELSLLAVGLSSALLAGRTLNRAKPPIPCRCLGDVFHVVDQAGRGKAAWVDLMAVLRQLGVGLRPVELDEIGIHLIGDDFEPDISLPQLRHVLMEHGLDPKVSGR